MKQSSMISQLLGAVLGISAVSFVILPAHAQDYYFDPGAMDSAMGSGGTGPWVTGVGSDPANPAFDWYLPGTGDVPFPDTSSSPIANFDGVGGMVTVDGSVTPASINFDGSTAYDVQADSTGSIDEGAVNNFNIANTGATATIAAPITFTGGTGNISVNLDSSSRGNIVFASTVTNTDTSGTPQFFQVNAHSGTTEFNGNIKGTNSGSDPNSGSPTNDNITVNGGATVLLDNSNFDRYQNSGTLLTNVAGLNVTATNSFTSGTGILGGNTAGITTFSGDEANFGTTQTLQAAQGGRVVFSGNIFGGGVNDHREVIAGLGIVNISTAKSYAVRYGDGNNNIVAPGSNNDVGTEINSGATLLITNISGSATGGAADAQAFGNGMPLGLNNVVQLDATGTLAGTGITQQQVVTTGKSSTLSPGEMTLAKVSSIGTLRLDNGLDATNGLTVNFDLNGTSSDQIQVGRFTTESNGNVAAGAVASELILNGAVTTFNFANLGPAIVDGQTDVLFISGANADGFDITNLNNITTTGADGFAANYSVVGTPGSQSLDVTFTSAPEPSTWALIGLSGLMVIGCGKFRRLRA